MRLRTLYEKLIGWRVLAGPFSGLRYVPEAVGSVHAPKLLGTYEQELHIQVEVLIARNPDVVVNIGAGEGYYAVGLARRLPHARIVAFEADAHGRELVGRVATLNGVDARVEVCGLCTVADLTAALHGATKPIIVIDAEGAEDLLLDPAKVPKLVRTAILVEVHDFILPEIGDLLLRRFAATHRHIEIWSRPRTAHDLPGFTRFAALTPWRTQAVCAMDEQRPCPMRWFWFEPLAA